MIWDEVGVSREILADVMRFRNNKLGMSYESEHVKQTAKLVEPVRWNIRRKRSFQNIIITQSAAEVLQRNHGSLNNA